MGTKGVGLGIVDGCHRAGAKVRCTHKPARRGILLAGALVACTPVARHPPGPVAQPVPVASPPPPAPAGTPRTHRIAIHDGAVIVDGERVADVPAASPGGVHGLSGIRALAARLRTRHSAGSDRAPYALDVDGQATVGQLKSVFETAAFAGWPTAVVDANGPVLLRAEMPLAAEAATPSWPHITLVVAVRNGGVQLSRAHPHDGSTPARPVGTAAAPAMLTGMLQQVCKDDPCTPAVLLVDDDIRYTTVRAVLSALRKTTGGTPLLVLLVQQPAPPDKPQHVWVGGGAPVRVSGVLPPDVIRKLIHEHYAALRRCYSDALEGDASLSGKVVVRFVIDRHGHVSAAKAGKGTTLPDQHAVLCVLDRFREIVFPEPKGGIVTVVYPIDFEPDPPASSKP